MKIKAKRSYYLLLSLSLASLRTKGPEGDLDLLLVHPQVTVSSRSMVHPAMAARPALPSLLLLPPPFLMLISVVDLVSSDIAPSPVPEGPVRVPISPTPLPGSTVVPSPSSQAPTLDPSAPSPTLSPAPTPVPSAVNEQAVASSRISREKKVGNEGNIDWFAENVGFMYEIAPRFKAMLVFIEPLFTVAGDYGCSTDDEG